MQRRIPQLFKIRTPRPAWGLAALAVTAALGGAAHPSGTPATAMGGFGDCPRDAECLWYQPDGLGIMLAVPEGWDRVRLSFVPASSRNNTDYTYCVSNAQGVERSKLLPRTGGNLFPIPNDGIVLVICE